MKRSKTPRNEYFRYQVLLWRIVGALDISEGNYWSWAMLLNFFVYFSTVLLIMSLFSYENPIDNFSLTIISFATLVRLLLYAAQLTKLVEIEELIGQLDGRVSGNDEVVHHQKMTKHMDRMSKLFLGLYVSVTVNIGISFLLKNERSLPLPMRVPFDWENSMAAYVWSLFLEEIAIFFQVMGNFAGDSFPPVALGLVSEQCQLLSLRISNLGYGSKTLKENEEDLVNCIDDQNTLYSLLRVIHSLISYPMLVLIFVNGINIAIAGCALVFYVETLAQRVYYVCFLLAFAMQTYPLCYYGTMVKENFAELHYAIFCSNWVDQSAVFRRNMLILAERTKREQRLFAGDLLPIHLSTFMACWKGAYSFFTLMADRNARSS
ncbi:odorant receptor 23a [Drosophila rhopaloa]|uniref:Odorant receptor n=1 Tax=Drosophila rhopaloa TaxID=1041015 RepID=A0ABM5I4H4_DRORH|nr:odorant receptor 23a [Drosophila rhopaloa]